MKKLFSFFLSLFLSLSYAWAQSTITQLLCENKINPNSVDAAQPRFTWQLTSAGRNVMQKAYAIQVSRSPSMDSKNLVWSSGKVLTDQSVQVSYTGPALLSGETYYWRVQVWDNSAKVTPWSKTAFWKMGMLRPSDWQAKWIEPGLAEEAADRPSPLLRKMFMTNKKVKSATAFITAHGMYEAFINGKRVGDDFLTPGWTSYNKRLQYQQYDVTNRVQEGSNAVGVVLGSGWYRGTIGYEGHHDVFGKDLALLLQVNITYSDGSRDTVVSDDSWKWSFGPIRYAEIYNGETYDARKEAPGWATARFNDGNWSAVAVQHYSMNNLVATCNEGVKKHERIKPVAIFKTPNGDVVADFGQNLVGWAQLTVNGKASDSITLYHAEVLDKAGNFYTTNLRAAKAKNTYILKGGGTEVFEPHFTWQGFRYVKVEGFPGALKADNLTAIALYSDMTPTGNFTSSNTLLNQLQHNIQWGQKGNFLDVPTDCPQRDERLGWTGDAQVFSRTAAFNMNVNSFFAKWLKDVAADQSAEGSIPFVIPNVLGDGAGGAAGWADVATVIPWNMYLLYGDKKILEDQYPSMKAWVDYMQKTSVQDLWTKGNVFGDWLFYRPFDDNDGRSAVTDKSLISEAFFAYSTQLLINAATVLGKREDAAAYASLSDKIKAAFAREFVTPGGRLASNTQTAYVLALNFDLLPEAVRRQAAERLVKNIAEYNYHLTTGFLGTPYLCHVLTRFGYADIAYRLLLQDTYPSWLYPVKMGATTIWERWDGQKPDSTFQTPGMNSFNHYAYGAIGDWMYRTVAGINTSEEGVGYKKIIIKPVIGGGLTAAAAELNSYYGKISCSWKVENSGVHLAVTIPANTSALIYIPAKGLDGVIETGKPLSAVTTIKLLGQEGDYVKVETGSGNYDFVIHQ